MSTLATAKQNVYDYVNASLGGGMIDVELDPIHYETCLLYTSPSPRDS